MPKIFASTLASCLQWFAGWSSAARSHSHDTPGPYGLLVENRSDWN